ncbi:hypothetical protein BGX28_002901 [Mortierella sp. GBA30]|nr:hypothetical protein BGX28_002901 [Mortierella sp. GBA30]
MILSSRQTVFEIRTSNITLLFELFSLLVSLPRLASLYRQAESFHRDDVDQEFRFLSRYFLAVFVAFVFDAWPRGWTQMQRESKKSRFEKANVFSRLTFHFIQPIISKGYHQPLQMDDIRNIMPSYLNTEAGAYQRLATNWENQLKAVEEMNRQREELQSVGASTGKSSKTIKKKTPSLLWATLKTFWPQFLLITTFQLSKSLLQFALPALLKRILAFIDTPTDPNDPNGSRDRGITLALCLLLVNVSLSMLSGQMFGLVVHTSAQVRSALISLIYRKALVLSPGARRGSTVGEITNHMSTDAEKINLHLIWVPSWISVPIELSLSAYMLYGLLGWSAFCGFAMVLVLSPVQVWVGKLMDQVNVSKMEAQDSRVRLMTEILSNIKIIKLYSYVEAFQQKVDRYRQKEVGWLRKAGIIDSFISIVYSCLPYVMAFVSFSVYALVGGPGFTPGEINAQIIFVSITLFGIVNQPLGAMSYVIESTIAIRVAMRRIQAFMLNEEIDRSALLHVPYLPNNPNTPVIEMNDATLAWDPDFSASSNKGAVVEVATETTALLSANNNTTCAPTLVDINLSIERSSLTAIVGRVGQGKSSLLSAMIGEMYKRKGTVKVFGTVAYVPQQAWVVNATVRDNIVFGKPFDQKKYDQVLSAAGLLPDIEMLSKGSDTEIGERGINLSGGQKQRISLARAAYMDADIYFLDDPLSAVDAHVDQHLWQYLIGPSGLLNNKTRVLVTHGIHHLEQMDQIVVVKDGKITEFGHYDALMKAKSAFYQLIKEFSVARKSMKGVNKIHQAIRNAISTASTDSPPSTTTASDDETEADSVVMNRDKTGDKEKESSGDLIEKEEMQDGLVSWGTFRIYCKAMSYRVAAITLVLYVIWEGFQLGIPVWLAHWSNVFESTDRTAYFFLGVYACLVMSFMITDVCVNLVLRLKACLRASVVMHDSALERVMRLPMSFFDATPQGRILNRFASDIASIDERIPLSIMHTLICGFNFIGNLLIISFSTPLLILALPPLLCLYWVVQKYFIRTSTVLKRLEAINKSPIYQHFTETLNGVSSIRAMHLQPRFIAEKSQRVDLFANAFYAWSMTNRWVNVRLEFLTAIIVFISALLSVLNKENLNPSMVGLSLSISLVLVESVIWFLRLFCALQGDLVSVERVHEYTIKNTEAPLVTGVHVPESWPSQGHIIFKNYSTRYREGLDLVLKNISFEVQPAEKVGIVGRTGAGKSSLTLALFRIVEAADSYWARASEQEGAAKDRRLSLLQKKRKLQDGPVDSISSLTDGSSIDGGSIEIDGIDISTLGLNDLRKHLAIIPQDPTLFAGTVRENLDPFNELDDAELWLALERAHLKDHVASLAGGLSFEVAQNGENFSVGQRSLICLARALLRKTKILILDEATAAVDVETDELIQRTIRQEFKDRTILTIAHRIKTVMDSDKILVLEKGRVEEYDSPRALIKQKQGLFYSLAEQAGEIH